MNSYITLDSLKYSTTQQRWVPTTLKPGSVRFTIEGTIDGTYGPDVFYVWQGEIRAPASAGAGWGTISDLRTTLAKRQSLTFIDHWGTSHPVHIVGEMPERFLTPDWASSLGFVQVRIIGTAASPSASLSPSASASPSASSSASSSASPSPSA